MTRIRIRKVRPLARGLKESYSAQLAVPMTGGDVGDEGEVVLTVGAVGFSFGSALRKATSFAKRITDDPIIQAAMPPQAKAAISVTRKLAKAAAHGRGELKRAYASLPPGARKSAKGLATKLLKKTPKRKRPVNRTDPALDEYANVVAPGAERVQNEMAPPRAERFPAEELEPAYDEDGADLEPVDDLDAAPEASEEPTAAVNIYEGDDRYEGEA